MTDPTNTPPAAPSAEAIEALRALEAKARQAGQQVMVGEGPMADYLKALLNAAPALLATVEAQRKECASNLRSLRASQEECYSLYERRDALAARVSYYESALCFTPPRPLALPPDGVVTGNIEPERVSEVLAERDALKAEVAKLKERSDRFEGRSRDYFNALEACCNALKIPQQLEVPKHVKRLLCEHLEQARKLSASEAEVERLRAALKDIASVSAVEVHYGREMLGIRTNSGMALVSIEEATAAALRGEEASRG